MSRNGSRSYTRQFREQAMDLVRVQGLDPTHAARELGMPFSTLNLWLRKAGWVRRVDGPHAAGLLREPHQRASPPLHAWLHWKRR